MTMTSVCASCVFFFVRVGLFFVYPPAPKKNNVSYPFTFKPGLRIQGGLACSETALRHQLHTNGYTPVE